MNVIKTKLNGLLVIEPNIFEDKRGVFFESYNEKTFKKSGIDTKFVQDNQSESKYGVIRGLHYQIQPYPQAKLVRVIEGKILDVAVDLRKDSETFGKYFSIILSAKNKKQFFIPRGFAHGFSVLSKKATVFYKCDNYWNKESERGILFNDKKLNIDWQIENNKFIVSEKDILLSTFKNSEIKF